MTAAAFRRLALSFPDAVESAHMGHPDFRVGGRIFATLGHAGAGFGMVALTPDEQAFFVGSEPATFAPVKGGWGKSGSTSVILRSAKTAAVRAALRAAWERRAGRQATGTAIVAPSPARQLASFIAKFDPAVARLIRSTRGSLRRTHFPTATELVYDNYNALAIGWTGSGRTSDVIASVAATSRGVVLYFTWGTTLPDPAGILLGGGNQGRFVRVESPATLRRAEVKALLTAAIRQARAPLPRTGKGATIIKSISKQQRPRRSSKPLAVRR
jgi:hypothetical protein